MVIPACTFSAHETGLTLINYIATYLNICQFEKINSERLKYNFIQKALEISGCLPRSQKWSSNQDPSV